MYPALQLSVSFFSVLESVTGNMVHTFILLFPSSTCISHQTEIYFPNYRVPALR